MDNQIRAAFEAAATNPVDASGIGVTASVSPASTAQHSLHYDIRIDPSDLVLIHQGDRDNGELAIGLFGIKNSQIEPSAPVLMNVSLTKEQLAAATKEGVPFLHDAVIADGVQKVRIVVLDLNSAETGALTVPVPH